MNNIFPKPNQILLQEQNILNEFVKNLENESNNKKKAKNYSQSLNDSKPLKRRYTINPDNFNKEKIIRNIEQNVQASKLKRKDTLFLNNNAASLDKRVNKGRNSVFISNSPNSLINNYRRSSLFDGKMGNFNNNNNTKSKFSPNLDIKNTLRRNSVFFTPVRNNIEKINVKKPRKSIFGYNSNDYNYNKNSPNSMINPFLNDLNSANINNINSVETKKSKKRISISTNPNTLININRFHKISQDNAYINNSPYNKRNNRSRVNSNNEITPTNKTNTKNLEKNKYPHSNKSLIKVENNRNKIKNISLPGTVKTINKINYDNILENLNILSSSKNKKNSKDENNQIIESPISDSNSDSVSDSNKSENSLDEHNNIMIYLDKMKLLGNSKIKDLMIIKNPDSMKRERIENRRLSASSQNSLIRGNHVLKSMINSEQIQQGTFILNKENKRFLIKNIKKVYDSLSDNTSEEEYLSHKPYVIFHPRSPYVLYLYYASFISLFISVIYSPYYFAFNKDIEHPRMILDIIVDFILIIQFLSTFVIGYYDTEEHYVFRYKSIFKRYLKSTMLIDIIAAIPFNTYFNISSYLDSNKYNLKDPTLSRLFNLYNRHGFVYSDHLSYTFTTFINGWERLRLFRFIFLITLINGSKTIIKEDLSLIKKKFKLFEGFEIIFLILLQFLILIHIFSCLWIQLTYSSPSNWIAYAKLSDSPTIEIYVTSIYFFLCTLLTIGYGDIIPVNPTERFFNLILLIFGTFIYTLILSYLSNTVFEESEVKKKYIKYKQTITNLEKTYKLKRNVVNSIIYFLSKSSELDNSEKTSFLMDFPLSLRRELVLKIYQNEIVYFSFFSKIKNTDTLIQALFYLKPYIASQNERLIEQNNIVENIYFLNSGRLRIQFEVNIKDLYYYNLSEKLDNLRKQEEMPRKAAKASIISQDSSGTIVDLNSGNLNSTNLNKSYQDEVLIGMIDNNDKDDFEDSFILRKMNSISNKQKNVLQYSNFQKYKFNGYWKNLNKTIPNLSSKKRIKILNLYKWDYYGDYYIFSDQRSPVSLISSTKDSELMLIKDKDFNNLVNTFEENLSFSLYVSMYNYQKLIKSIKSHLNEQSIILNMQIDNPEKDYFKFDFLSKDELKEEHSQNKFEENVKTLKKRKKNSTVLKLQDKQDQDDRNFNSNSHSVCDDSFYDFKLDKIIPVKSMKTLKTNTISDSFSMNSSRAQANKNKDYNDDDIMCGKSLNSLNIIKNNYCSNSNDLNKDSNETEKLSNNNLISVNSRNVISEYFEQSSHNLLNNSSNAISEFGLSSKLVKVKNSNNNKADNVIISKMINSSSNDKLIMKNTNKSENIIIKNKNLAPNYDKFNSAKNPSIEVSSRSFVSSNNFKVNNSKNPGNQLKPNNIPNNNFIVKKRKGTLSSYSQFPSSDMNISNQKSSLFNTKKENEIVIIEKNTGVKNAFNNKESISILMLNENIKANESIASSKIKITKLKKDKNIYEKELELNNAIKSDSQNISIIKSEPEVIEKSISKFSPFIMNSRIPNKKPLSDASNFLTPNYSNKANTIKKEMTSKSQQNIYTINKEQKNDKKRIKSYYDSIIKNHKKTTPTKSVNNQDSSVVSIEEENKYNRNSDKLISIENFQNKVNNLINKLIQEKELITKRNKIFKSFTKAYSNNNIKDDMPDKKEYLKQYTPIRINKSFNTKVLLRTTSQDNNNSFLRSRLSTINEKNISRNNNKDEEDKAIKIISYRSNKRSKNKSKSKKTNNYYYFTDNNSPSLRLKVYSKFKSFLVENTELDNKLNYSLQEGIEILNFNNSAHTSRIDSDNISKTTNKRKRTRMPGKSYEGDNHIGQMSIYTLPDEISKEKNNNYCIYCRHCNKSLINNEISKSNFTISKFSFKIHSTITTTSNLSVTNFIRSNKKESTIDSSSIKKMSRLSKLNDSQLRSNSTIINQLSISKIKALNKNLKIVAKNSHNLLNNNVISERENSNASIISSNNNESNDDKSIVLKSKKNDKVKSNAKKNISDLSHSFINANSNVNNTGLVHLSNNSNLDIRVNKENEELGKIDINITKIFPFDTAKTRKKTHNESNSPSKKNRNSSFQPFKFKKSILESPIKPKTKTDIKEKKSISLINDNSLYLNKSVIATKTRKSNVKRISLPPNAIGGNKNEKKKSIIAKTSNNNITKSSNHDNTLINYFDIKDNNRRITSYEKCLFEINKKISNKKHNKPETMLKQLLNSELNKN